MSEYLYAALMVAALVRPSLASAVFVSITVLFDVLFSGLSGGLYFPVASLFDLLIIIIVSTFRADSKAITIVKISVISVILNFVGLVAWWMYLPSDVYVCLFYALYAVAFLALLKKDNPDAGNILGGHALSFRSWRDNSGAY